MCRSGCTLADRPLLPDSGIAHQERQRVLARNRALPRIPLKRATITDVLAGRKFPRKAFLLTFVEACGVDLEEDDRWEQAWNCLAVQYQDQTSGAGAQVEQLVVHSARLSTALMKQRGMPDKS